ncbi:MAG: carboxypeptidase regulatory-like domain-containing protein, partial [Ardenticatenales bacterium]|nr:carboxypeptidase regulatory-like domain-containing protein [Ardenticatenales bacterium]
MSVSESSGAEQAIALTVHAKAPERALTLPWLYLGTPGAIPSLAVGQSLEFTVFASPTDTLSLGSYQDYLTVSADGGQTRQVALTVNVTSNAARDVQLKVTDEEGAPLDAGKVILIDQALTSQTVEGKELLLHQQHSATVDSNGTANLSALAPGSYNYVVAADGYYQGGGQLLLTPGDAPETLSIALQQNPFTFEWDVKSINDVEYDITLTMTYDVKAKPEIIIDPRYWHFDTCTVATLTDTLTLRNVSIIPIDLTDLDLSVPGVVVEHGPYPAMLDGESSITVPVTATLTGEPGQGQAMVAYTYKLARDNKLVTYTFTKSAVQGTLRPGSDYIEQYSVEPGTFEEDVLYTTHLSEPFKTEWLRLVLEQNQPMRWTDQTTIPVTLTANVPVFVTEGEYSDQSTIRVTGSDGSEREGYVTVTLKKNADEFFLESHFTLGPIPYTNKVGSNVGGIYPDKARCESGSSGDGGNWRWNAVGGGVFTGQYSGNSMPQPGFPAPAPVYETEHQQVRLELQQRAMLEGENFAAYLLLRNITDKEFEIVSARVSIKSQEWGGGTDKFTVLPLVPIQPGPVAPGQSTALAWTILPDEGAVSDPQGEQFLVSASIDYRLNGTLHTLHTMRDGITVYPAPKLKLTYRLPMPDSVCKVFNLNLIVTNEGVGAARDLRLRSVQPEIIENQANLKIGFDITETYINGVPQANELNLALGNVAPGETKVVTWRIEASAAGRFIELAADYKQVNYQQFDLTPAISEVNTEFVHPSDPIFQGCVRFDDPDYVPQPTVEVTVVSDTMPVHHLTLNDDGWPTPNPLMAIVTLTCPEEAEADCVGGFDFNIASSDDSNIARFFVHAPGEFDPEGEQAGLLSPFTEEHFTPAWHEPGHEGLPIIIGTDPAYPPRCLPMISGSSEFSFYTYSVQCYNLPVQPGHEADFGKLLVRRGHSLTFQWPLWVQPSEAYDLQFIAEWAEVIRHRVLTATHKVKVPRGEITPIVFLPGLGATQPPSYDQQAPWWPVGSGIQEYIKRMAGYRTLFTTLQKMGYKENKTLFFFRYDWLRSAVTGADMLWELLLDPEGDIVRKVAELPEVKGYGNPDDVKFDLIGHSTGNLLARAYMQIPYQGVPRTNIRRYIGIAGPQIGLVNGYTGLEGQDTFIEEPLGGSPNKLGSVAFYSHQRARRHHYCQGAERVWGIPIPFTCHVSEADAYAFTHDPVNGPTIIPHFLPTADFTNYLQSRDSGDPYPYGRPANPLLEAKEGVVTHTCVRPASPDEQAPCWENDALRGQVIDPYDNPFTWNYLDEVKAGWEGEDWRGDARQPYATQYHGLNTPEKLEEWNTRLGGDLSQNVCFIYNSEHATKEGSQVAQPQVFAPYWLNGSHQSFIAEPNTGDKLIATISANPTDPEGVSLNWGGKVPLSVHIDETEHGPIVGNNDSIQSITDFLTGAKVPFLIGFRVAEFEEECAAFKPAATTSDFSSNSSDRISVSALSTQEAPLEENLFTRALLLTVQGPADLTLVDPQGQRIGYDVTSGEILTSTDSFYFPDRLTAENYLWLDKPLAG